MCGMVGSIVVLVIGVILVIGTNLVGFVAVPELVRSIISSEVVLRDDTIQMERFKEVPFSLYFRVRIFNISNPEDVLNGGIPVVTEVGPYVYRLYQGRNISRFEEDTLTYRRMEYFEFDAEASYPYSEDDVVTMVNIPYHAIIQIAERSFPNLLSVLNLAMDGVFRELNSPITRFRIGNLILQGVPFCTNPGLIGAVACTLIREIGQNAQNIAEREDGSLAFSVLGYKQGIPSAEYRVFRGLNDPGDLGRIITLDDMPNFFYWKDVVDENGVTLASVCNMINGTDSGIYAPFIKRDEKLYAINTDICRSLELRYQHDVEVQGITAARYSANEWFLDNDDGCFCINLTTGINREDGCLLRGAMEMQECVGAPLVLTYPHFLYADQIYRNNIFGMMPIEDDHRIFLDIETNSGTPIRGAKRAQFNIFMRPVNGISDTRALRTSLVPFIWVEEYFLLPDEFAEELRTRLIGTLEILDIVIPVLITLSCVVFVIGVVLTVRVTRKNHSVPTTVPPQTLK